MLTLFVTALCSTVSLAERGRNVCQFHVDCPVYFLIILSTPGHFITWPLLFSSGEAAEVRVKPV